MTEAGPPRSASVECLGGVRARGQRGRRIRHQPGAANGGERHREGHGAEQSCGGDQRSAGVDPPHREEEQAEYRVRGQDVAVEQQDGVQHSDREQAGETAAESRAERHAAPGRRGDLQRETVAEQEREEQVRLHRDRGVDEPDDGAINPGIVPGVGDEVERISRGEEGDVDYQNAEQGHAT